MTSGSAYAVTVSNQPSTEREVCSVSNASGTVDQAAVTNISVGCSIVTGFLYSATGPSNQILTFGISAGAGTLLPTGAPVATGSDPWHMVTASGGQFLYAGNFLSGTISAYAVDAGTGALTAVGPAVPISVQPAQLVMSAAGFL
jgi:6-phosphogluconolactonase (cycloisomerase 2 family)